MIRQQGQQRVRGGAGDDFQEAQLLELPKGAHQIATAGGVGIARGDKSAVIEEREFVKGLFPLGPMDFLGRKLNQLVEVPLVAGLQERIQQHRAECGG